MNQYQNAYIGLSVEFPEHWRYRYWGNRKEGSTIYKHLQRHNEDLPSESSPHKVLVTSLPPFEKGSVLPNAIFEMVALYRPNEIDLKMEIPNNESEISRNYGNCNIACNESMYVNVESQGENYIRYTRYCYWRFQPKIWVGCVASGVSIEKFNEALSIIENIKAV